MTDLSAQTDTRWDDAETLGFVRELYHAARGEKRKLYPSWNRFYRLIRNRSWSDLRSAQMPSPQASEIFPTLATLVAWMTDQPPRLFVYPSGQVDDQFHHAYADAAKNMQTMFDSLWVTQGFRKQEEMVLWDNFVYGAGFFKTGFDPGAEQGLGQVTLTRTDPYNIYPDPEASDLNDCRYLIEARRVSFQELERRFPDRFHLVTPDGPAGTADRKPKATGLTVLPQAEPGQAPGVPPLYGPPGGASESAVYSDTVLLLEVWLKEVEKVPLPVISQGERAEDSTVEIETWRVICAANGVILADVASPFDHGMLPYTRMVANEVGEFWGIPLVEHLAPAQISLNRILACMQINAELVGNPIWIEDSRSGIPRSRIINKPGTRLVKNPNSTAEWAQPPQMPPFMERLLSFWREDIERVSGLGAVARGANLRRREPAAAVDSTQEAAFVRIRAAIRNLEDSLRDASEMLASNIVQFYTEPRTVALVGPSGTQSFLELRRQHFWKMDPQGQQVPMKFNIWVQAGSSMPLSRQARAAEADALASIGMLDEEAVLEAHDYPNRDAIVKRLMEKKAQGLIQPGGPRRHRAQ